MRHRNHLGAMLGVPTGLSTNLLTGVDFTDPLLPTYGTDARKTVGSTAVLWTGNVLRDTEIKYTGSSHYLCISRYRPCSHPYPHSP